MSKFEWKLDKSIALVGIMGAGKSHLGRLLSKAFDMPFVDTDHEIIKASSCSIQDIFDIYGFDELRALEERVFKRIVKVPKQIISTGDAVFINPVNRKLIKEKAVSVWLRAEPELVFKRTHRTEHRPLLKTDKPKKILMQLIQERDPIYAEADLTVDSEDIPPYKMSQKIIQALLDYQEKVQKA